MPQIVMKDKAITETLEQIAEAFCNTCPDFVDAMKSVIAAESDNLVKPSGMSRGGTMLTWCKIPTVIYSFVKQQMRKRHGIDDFFSDERNFRLLVKVWKDLLVKRQPTKFLAN